jgi:hypothetical protein
MNHPQCNLDSIGGYTPRTAPAGFKLPSPESSDFAVFSNALTGIAEDTERAAAELEARLSLVMRHPVPENAQCGEKTLPDPQSPIGEELFRSYSAFYRLRARLNSIISKLEI